MLTLIAHIDWFWYLVIVSISVLVFLMAQHNKNNIKLEPEEIERLKERLEAADLGKKERKQILAKLKPQEKADKLRKSRQSKERKKPKKDEEK